MQLCAQCIRPEEHKAGWQVCYHVTIPNSPLTSQWLCYGISWDGDRAVQCVRRAFDVFLELLNSCKPGEACSSSSLLTVFLPLLFFFFFNFSLSYSLTTDDAVPGMWGTVISPDPLPLPHNAETKGGKVNKDFESRLL